MNRPWPAGLDSKLRVMKHWLSTSNYTEARLVSEPVIIRFAGARWFATGDRDARGNMIYEVEPARRADFR